ncbi:hypothetical protein E1200_11530 [Actinomadura sp. GC306]|uniref:hypothetical protein n=1 Tax=Actinomadura sp. GC306 TaxID=2530367 RepID=UPI00104DC45C|nr:hypothetical protein [Actinomadura sp. GC306]TDC68484.1 hypothetical protein E1200_11530 [Actinomadura sp. GC306]
MASSNTNDDGSFFTKPHWQAVGAVAAIVGLLLTYAIYKWQNGEEEVRRTPVEQKQKINNGNCNVQGERNNVECGSMPAGIKRVIAELDGNASFIFVGSPSELPTPPPYPADRAIGHCPFWHDWMATEPRVYALSASNTMYLQAGSRDVLSIIKTSVTVTERRKMASEYILIRCQYGAGGEHGTEVVTDTRTGTSEVVDLNTGREAKMPPFVLNLKDMETSSALLRIEGQPGYLYTGSWTASLLFNGEPAMKTLGMSDKVSSFRWLGSDESGPDMEVIFDAPAYDWDLEKKQWVRVYNAPPNGVWQ